MSKCFSTAIAGSTLLLMGAAFAQESGQSQTQDSQTQERMDRSSAGASSSTSDAQSSNVERDDASNQGAEAEDSKDTRMASASGAQPVVMMLLVPISMESKADNTLANGCWAKLYDDYNYGGDSFTLVGPLDLPKMVGPFGIDWDDKVSSIKTGPKATVTIYDNENFRDRAAKIKPAQQVPQLTEKMGLLEDPNSMRIHCGGTTASS